jgi:predicted nucleic acid-binding protein
MKRFLDTSVLVPVFYGDHQHHDSSLALFVSCDQTSSCCGAHGLVEVFATLTRLPGKYRVSAEQAMLFIGSIRDRLSVVALESEDYIDTREVSAALGIVGGSIYDAILARCALKACAETIYTWNIRHYAQCGHEVLARLQTP